MRNNDRLINSLKTNNSLYETVYCQIVADNDYIIELKRNIEACKEDIKAGNWVELCQSQLKTYKEQLKDTQKHRRELKKVMRQLFGDSCEDYSD